MKKNNSRDKSVDSAFCKSSTRVVFVVLDLDGLIMIFGGFNSFLENAFGETKRDLESGSFSM